MSRRRRAYGNIVSEETPEAVVVPAAIVVPKETPEPAQEWTDEEAPEPVRHVEATPIPTSSNASESKEDIDMNDVVTDATGKVVIAGNDNDVTSCVRDQLTQGFSNIAQVHLVDAVRDAGRNAEAATYSTSQISQLAIQTQGAANALATATAELRLSKEILKEACETRALVGHEAAKTRDLINGNELQRLRDELAAARTQVTALQVAASVTVTP